MAMKMKKSKTKTKTRAPERAAAKDAGGAAKKAGGELHKDLQDMLKELNLPGASADDFAKAAAVRSTRKGKQDQEPLYEGDSSDDEENQEMPDGMAEAYGDLDDDSEQEDDEDVEDDEMTPGSRKHTVFEDADDDDEDDDDDDDDEEDEEDDQGGQDENDGDAEPEAGALWFEDAAARLATLETESEAEVAKMEPSERSKLKREKYETVAKLRTRAEALVKKRASALAAQRRNDPDTQWMRKVMHSGTVSDKVAAMALSVSSAPAEQLDTLESLVNMSSSKGRREAELAMDALADLFINNLLPSDRPLRSFNEQIEALSAKGRKKVTEDHLQFWMVEGEIKAKFLQFVRSLEQWSFDTVDYTKRKAVTTAYRLLRQKPEQEQMLLMLIVNKLGDSTKRLASHVVYLLGQLLDAHPNMRTVVATEVEQFLFRPRTPGRGIYYGAVFLNQIILQRGGADEELAQKLIGIYIRLFKHSMGIENLGETDTPAQLVVAKKSKKRGRKGAKGRGHKNAKKGKHNATAEPTIEVSTEDIKSRLLSAILTGVNRAFPYANSQGSDFEEQIDTLFKMVHVSSFGTATQALMLLLQIMLSRNALSDRFFRTLYAKMFDEELRTSSKQTMFLNVLFRAVKHDVVLPRIRAFLKRMLQVAANSSAPFAAGVLVLVSAVIRERPVLNEMVLGSESAIPARDAQPEAEADTKEETKANSSDDEDDEDDEDEDDSQKQKLKLLVVDEENDESDEADDASAQGKSASADAQGANASALVDGDSGGDVYDPSKREPRFAGCSKSCLMWEISAFARHYHPSVRKFALDLLKDPSSLAYEGDPLRDFSGTAFLDRFVYRNPRQRDIDTLKSNDNKHAFGMHGRIARMGRKATADAVNSAKFLLKSEEEVPEEDRFFHEYFHRQAQQQNRDLRSDLYEKLANSKSGSSDPFLNDEEDKVDAYADKLAEDLMQSTFGNPDIDGNLDLDLDYSEDEDGEDDGAPAGKKTRKGKTTKKAPAAGTEAELFGDEDSDSDADEDAVLDGEALMEDDSDEDEDEDMDDDAGGVFAFADSDDDEDEESDGDDDEEAGESSRPRKRNKTAASFADADAFAQLLEGEPESAKEKKWLQKQESSDFAESRRRAQGQRGRGGRGGRGGHGGRGRGSGGRGGGGRGGGGRGGHGSGGRGGRGRGKPRGRR